MIQIYYGVDIKGLDYFNFIKYYHIKFKTVGVDNAEDRSFDVLLDLEGFNVRAFELKLETGSVGLHIVDGDGVVGHG